MRQGSLPDGPLKNYGNFPVLVVHEGSTTKTKIIGTTFMKFSCCVEKIFIFLIPPFTSVTEPNSIGGLLVGGCSM